jgi:fructoselysine-6-P-deglycase FrlB-like protein
MTGLPNGITSAPGAFMAEELASQPAMWERAAALAGGPSVLPANGARVAVVGCGTSWFIAQSYASLREAAGSGITHAYAASEASIGDEYDALIAITRSGTTTEVLELLESTRGRIPTIAIVGDLNSPVMGSVDDTVALDFADERSVVQTRFATSVLAYLRASLGHDLSEAIQQANEALTVDLSETLLGAEQYTFLAHGWAIGLASEAALKMREASQSWTESYPVMEYRHGPISIAGPGRVTWMLGTDSVGMRETVAATGAHFENVAVDPMAELIRVQRVALARALARSLDPDRPRNLSRSVVLR